MFSSGDYFAMIGMAFALVMTLVIGGFVLLFPIARRLGETLEEWVRIRRQEAAGGIPAEELAGLHRALESLQEDVDRLLARQEFVESLLEPGPGAEREDARARSATGPTSTPPHRPASTSRNQ